MFSLEIEGLCTEVKPQDGEAERTALAQARALLYPEKAAAELSELTVRSLEDEAASLADGLLSPSAEERQRAAATLGSFGKAAVRKSTIAQLEVLIK